MRMYDVKVDLQVEAGTQGEAISRAGQVMEALEHFERILDENKSFHYNYTTGLATEIYPRSGFMAPL